MNFWRTTPWVYPPNKYHHSILQFSIRWTLILPVVGRFSVRISNICILKFHRVIIARITSPRLLLAELSSGWFFTSDIWKMHDLLLTNLRNFPGNIFLENYSHSSHRDQDRDLGMVGSHLRPIFFQIDILGYEEFIFEA